MSSDLLAWCEYSTRSGPLQACGNEYPGEILYVQNDNRINVLTYTAEPAIVAPVTGGCTRWHRLWTRDRRYRSITSSRSDCRPTWLQGRSIPANCWEPRR